MTGDSGEAFLAALTPAQRKQITDLPDLQRQDLAGIVKIRRAIATELRRFQKGETASQENVLALSRKYGGLDGEMAYFYATAFASVGKSLSAEQRQQLTALRGHNDPPSPGAFLYSQRIEKPAIANTDFLFAPAK